MTVELEDDAAAPTVDLRGARHHRLGLPDEMPTPGLWSVSVLDFESERVIRRYSLDGKRINKITGPFSGGKGDIEVPLLETESEIRHARNGRLIFSPLTARGEWSGGDDDIFVEDGQSVVSVSTGVKLVFHRDCRTAALVILGTENGDADELTKRNTALNKRACTPGSSSKSCRSRREVKRSKRGRGVVKFSDDFN